LPTWKRETSNRQTGPHRTLSITSWRDPLSGLQLDWLVTTFLDFAAVDWVLYLKNTGTNDTPMISEWQALDVALGQPSPGAVCYQLHRTKGAPSDATDFEPTLVRLSPGAHEVLGGGGGRSSNKDFPFVKLEAADASYIMAVGWSGQWAMDLVCREDRRLHVTSGLELTHFILHPGESVRSPRMLIFRQEGDAVEANARFRELIYEHYAARLRGVPPLPALFCNTCFTRGGGWLNECNASNQVSLIRAYAPLGLEALITDAGWFEGGWPAGAGNWNPRRDAYPEGMRSVAAAARGAGMAYGLWFEFERVMAGTALAQPRVEIDVEVALTLLCLLRLVVQHLDLAAQLRDIGFQLLDLAEELDQALVLELQLERSEAILDLLLDLRQAEVGLFDAPPGFVIVEERRAGGQRDERHG
jgi:alpha-galactosidase